MQHGALLRLLRVQVHWRDRGSSWEGKGGKVFSDFASTRVNWINMHWEALVNLHKGDNYMHL